MTRHTFTPKEAALIRDALLRLHGVTTDRTDAGIIWNLVKEFEGQITFEGVAVPQVGDTVRWRGLRGFKDSFAFRGVRFERAILEGKVTGILEQAKVIYLNIDLGPGWMQERYVTIPASQITEIISNG